MYDPNSTTASNLTFNVLNALDEPPRLSAQEQMCLIINIILNIITYPFTVLLNASDALVIIAVKTRPTLQSNANILLACLAAIDAVSGVLAQPSFILYMMLLHCYSEWVVKALKTQLKVSIILPYALCLSVHHFI